MRPRRIELEGFGSFRDATTVDLEDVDLFVLAGPTGSGKTTIVESLVFACYGNVPRYDDRRLVAPVINQGRNEARVRATFSVGERTYAATRVVRRTKTGATTKEARLEDVTGGGSRVIAGNADEVTTAIVDLLGLSFEQFTRSVVLPQGAFDRFLFAKPADRADLLVQLLDLGVYDDIGKRARARATATEARSRELERRLEGELADATPQARDAAAAELRRLEDLAGRCQAVLPELEAIVEEGRRRRQEADQAAADRDALLALRRPEGTDALGDELAAAATARARAEDSLAQATEAVETAEERLSELPEPEPLAELRRTVEELERTSSEREQRRAAAAEAEDRSKAAAARQQEADARVTAARERVEAATRRDLAATLASDLRIGEPCPVCANEVTARPHHGDTSALEAARKELADAEARREEALQQAASAAREAAAADQAWRSTTEQAQRQRSRRDELAAALQVTAEPTALEALAQRLATAQETLATARGAERQARLAVRKAIEASERLRERERAAWTAFDAARDAVARLGPPPVDRGDLNSAWEQLLTWAQEQRPAAEEAATAAAAEVERTKARWRELDASLRRECAEAGVEIAAGTAPQVAIAQAEATARSRLAGLEERLERARTAREELRTSREEHAVAKALGDHLRADGFERWLLTRALRLLVHGASGILRDLSSGAYSLALDDSSQFLVVDHRNADEPRTVRSLSGGERFLASLALALALAEHVAQLAAEGAARLESLFLDEGFGTLDADTLDVVASAIEELGARGRMVGIVTHVRDLAERLPVRFDVRRGPTGSVIQRVDAETAAGAEEPPTTDRGTDDDGVALDAEGAA